jgi:hypothetical protein
VSAPRLVRGNFKSTARDAIFCVEESVQHDREMACPGLDPGWIPVSRLRDALVWTYRFSLNALAGEVRLEKIMLKQRDQRSIG